MRRHPSPAYNKCEAPASRWVVDVREGNHSAFGGYRFQSSAYSSVRCLDCGWHWRSKGRYVAALPDATDRKPVLR